MKIISADLFEFSLSLHKQVSFGGSSFNERNGLILRLVDTDDNVGWGEASPLPGFSKESLHDARSQLKTVAASLVNSKPDVLKIFELSESDATTNQLLFPSVRFAMESALASLWSRATDNPLGQLFGKQSERKVVVNALLLSNGDNTENRIASILEEGFTTIKIKVASGDPTVDAKLINKIWRIIPNGIKIRLDANRKWNFEQASVFADMTAGCEIEYIEEPIDDSSKLSHFIEKTGMRVALDETLCEIEPHELSEYGKIAAVVLKPTLLGGFNRALAFQRAATACGAKVVLSSSFESGLTTLALAEFASAVCEPNCACGFDTLRYFREDTILERPTIKDGTINLSYFRKNEIEINNDLLRSIKND